MENAFVKLTMLWAPPQELVYSTFVHQREYLASNPTVHQWAKDELEVLMKHPGFFDFMRNQPLGFYSVLFHMGLHKDHEGGGPDGIVMGNNFMVKRLGHREVSDGIMAAYTWANMDQLFPRPKEKSE